jgi:curli biogenesis system outer membrane secretion channel CsgG
LKIVVLMACMSGLGGCVQDPLPSASPDDVIAKEIVLPPPPPRALTVAIYNCIDTTGQRRPTGASQELSSAVPMDCSPYLVEAVRSLTPGYVFLVERQHVDELLRERQLAALALNTLALPVAPPDATAGPPAGGRPPTGPPPTGRPFASRPFASRAAASRASGAPPAGAPPAGPAPAAPPSGGPPAGGPPQIAPPRRLSTLRVAEVLLIGQVVAYDRQTRQISGGLALAGIGGTGTVVTDLVTFSLRAVAVQTGEILGQSSVTKSITSQTIGGHVTKVWPTTILDLEIGDGVNEPVGLALREAIRRSLTVLVSRGVHDGWWGPMASSSP